MEPLQSAPLWPLAVYFILTVAVTAGMMILSYVLGERHRGRVTGDPFESGIMPTGTTGVRFDVRYYLVAMFFVVFDVEAVFLLAWAIAFREAGWTGYLGVLVFIAVLIAALIYLWRSGALDWGTARFLSQKKVGRKENA